MSTPYQTTAKRSPKKLYVPGVREPVHLPVEEFDLPTPEQKPPEPRPFSWLTMLTPAASIGASLIMVIISQITGNNTSLLFICPTVTMAMIHPMIGLIRARSSKKKYLEQMEKRRKHYTEELIAFRQDLDAQVRHHKKILQHAYPPPEALVEIGLARGKFRRLWYRRLGTDSDFLSLRVGNFSGTPALVINDRTNINPDDELKPLSQQILKDYTEVKPLPYNLPMDKIGSLGICGDDKQSFQVTQRLLLDAFVHHSPTDLLLVILSDRPDARERWRDYKWLPHTRVMQNTLSFSGLALDKGAAQAMLSWLVSEFDRRREIDHRYFEASDDIPYVLVVFDDSGKFRQDPEINPMIKWGHTCRMTSMILGDFALPQIRARLNLQEGGKFRYVETWEEGETNTGDLDAAPMETLSKVCRALAGLEMITEAESSTLPESLPLSATVEDMWLTKKAVENNWQHHYQDHELLQVPAGVFLKKKDIFPLIINLLPAERGGFDAYHSILIGTTGSGKSEFMKSLVLAAAYRYPPDLLNFFFLDFKGGAAFDPFKELPHVTGIVTNLQPELVDRGLVAVQSEIDRRQAQFAEAEVRDIWAYNQQPGNEPLPHMWLMLDEFAKGLTDFPELNPVLDLLVRQGRSLGMYLLLANQDVNNSVNKLLSNVGWRIALKVGRKEEMKAILEEKLEPTIRPGHGYIRTPQNEIVEFQSGYAGFRVLEEEEKETSDGFEILLINDNGMRQKIFHQKFDKHKAGNVKPKVTEQERLIQVMTQASGEMKLPPARKIYHDPLPAEIALADCLDNSMTFRTFDQGAWSGVKNSDQFLKAVLGYNDHIQSGRQFPLQIDFRDKDGHLWIVGAVGSGKEMTITSLILSMASTHLPEEAQFYIIEGGSGKLKTLQELPHTGAVVRLAEKERLERLLAYIGGTIEKRQAEGFDSDLRKEGSQPHLFLVINNFIEFRNAAFEYLDQASSFVQGGRVGVHMIFVTNLARDLPGKLASNLARKMVLQQANNDEYMNFLPRGTAPLSFAVPGRGYWVDDYVTECQVATPMLSNDGQPANFASTAKHMTAAWDGEQPLPIETLPEVITLADVIKHGDGIDALPIGLDFHSLLPVVPKLEDLASALLVLGETRCGKSNYLQILIEHLHNLGGWEMHAVCLRPSPIRKMAGKLEDLQVYASEVSFTEGLASLPERLQQSSALKKKLLVCFDDLGAAFQPGKVEVESLLEKIGTGLRNREQPDVLFIASGQINEFRMKSGTNTLIRILSQNKTGLCLSQDMQAWGWMGLTPQDVRPFGKMLFPPGRGFYINRGSLQVVQTPQSKYASTKGAL